VLADACEVDNLRKVPLDGVDVLAAVTGDDEDNLVVSLLAKQEFAVPRVIARVNNPKNHWMFNENWGVDVAVSTPHLLTSLVEEAVSVGTLVRLLSFERGRASLIEVTLANDAKAANRDIVELDFPRDSTIVAVLREERVIFPRGDTRLLPGTRCSCSSPPTARATSKPSSRSGDLLPVSTRALILAALLCGLVILLAARDPAGDDRRRLSRVLRGNTPASHVRSGSDRRHAAASPRR
jgi:Trk K+ transport system NAD-binding subunit